MDTTSNVRQKVTPYNSLTNLKHQGVGNIAALGCYYYVSTTRYMELNNFTNVLVKDDDSPVYMDKCEANLMYTGRWFLGHMYFLFLIYN